MKLPRRIQGNNRQRKTGRIERYVIEHGPVCVCTCECVCENVLMKLKLCTKVICQQNYSTNKRIASKICVGNHFG